MQQLLSSLEAERQRQFRRFVWLSAAFHVLLGLAFWIGPIRHSGKVLPAVERVNLVEALPSNPGARPAPPPPQAKPKPTPLPPPPPPPPPPEVAKVLPKQPAPLPKPKPPEAKPKPAKPEKQPEKPKPPEPQPEQELDDVLAQLRNEKGEKAPRPVDQQAAAPPGAGPAGGPGVVVDPETARWIREVKIHVTRAWILPAGFRTEALVTVVEVDLSSTGQVLGTSTRQSSGNPWYDESVERAIKKASPVPAPPEAGEWQFTFDSREQL